jgi:VWA domain-containing protein
MTRLRRYRACGVDLLVYGPMLAWSPQTGGQAAHSRGVWPPRLPDFTGLPEPMIRQRVASTVVMFAIDGSGSVHGPEGTDPEGARNAACLSILDLMRRHGGGRAGVVHWGETAPAGLALRPVPVGQRRLHRAVSLQPMLGGTNPAAALARVRELVPHLGAGQKLAVLLLTDGQDLGEGLGPELARLPARSVHLILADPSGDCFGHEAAWRALPWGSFTRLDNLRDHERVAWESGAVIARSIGLRLPRLMPA